MNTNSPQQHTPLLTSVSQYEVDFVIPRLGMDLQLGIDPFLLFKSRDQTLSMLHSQILQAFNTGIELIRNGKLDDARQLFSFPEVAEIGLGYTKKGKRGSGVGSYIADLIIETLKDSPPLLERGLKHIEEMQLVSVGIGPDRISDITANLLKHFLIEYTQKQCALWQIQLTSGVPVSNIFDYDTLSWTDSYVDLPISPFDKSPILLVPRRIVRALPWINYDDYFRMEFSAYLRAKRVQGKQSAKVSVGKQEIISISRREVERIDSYISRKESTEQEAQPSQEYIDQSGICRESEGLKARLRAVAVGKEQATDYQRLVLEVLNFLFNPELINGELEVETVDGTERRDIIFTNDSDKSFWAYLRTEHSSIFLMFEVKNTESLSNIYFNQVATYLGDRLGRLGFIVTRHPMENAQREKAFSIYNDSHPRKIILTLSDDDLNHMLDMKCAGGDPMRHVQELYRQFRTTVQ